jgi:hypothetical protein
MKKIMTSMLGLSLLLGAATVAFAQDTTKTTAKSKKKTKTTKSTTSTSKM